MKYPNLKRVVLLSILAATALATVPAQAGWGAWYWSGELGVNFASGLDTQAGSNDRASVCDEYINPDYALVETGGTNNSYYVGTANMDIAATAERYSSINCTGPNRGEGDDWFNDIANATGVLAGMAAGRRLGKSLRFEVEYFYRDSNHDEASDIFSASGSTADKLMQELIIAIDGVDSVRSHNLFLNVYYDFVGTGPWTPYVGAGIGYGDTEIEYYSEWTRNSDANNIDTGEGLRNAATIQANLAGTSSTLSKDLEETLFAFQVMAGVDYALSATRSVGVKVRYVEYDSLSDSIVWNPLRSHVPNLRLDGSEPVSGRIRFDNIELLAISLRFKQEF